MAATDLNDAQARSAAPAWAGSLVLAALALPGVLPSSALAEEAPEKTTLNTKLLLYQDSQPGLTRVRVFAPSLQMIKPLNPHWSLEGSAVLDSVSGASPRAYTSVSSASHMEDHRVGLDGKLTHYADRSAWSFGAALSKEEDYQSTALSGDARFSSADNNTTWNVGLGFSNDRIDSSNGVVNGEKKRVTEVMGGVTQAWSPRDLVQLNLTYTQGRGYYSDPYKFPDNRPRSRDQSILLMRWNHHVENWGDTLRTSYRYYSDTFGIKAHTLGEEWVHPVNERWTVTPALRYYSQSSAKFYVDPEINASGDAIFPTALMANLPANYSGDQRLSAFGAVTLGLKLGYKLDSEWSGDFKLEQYEQRSNWRLGGQGSPNIAAFHATSLQFGVSRRF